MARPLKNMKKDFRQLKQFIAALPKLASNAYENFIQDNFEAESFEDVRVKKWPKRKGKERGRRKLLVKSGALRRSLNSRMYKRPKRIEIIFSSNLPYAKIHNEGGSFQKSTTVRGHRRRTKRGVVSVRRHKRQQRVQIPERQFMGPSARFRKNFGAYIERRLSKLNR